MLSDLLKTLRVIYCIERDNISYRELIEFFYGETPPKNHNFLRYDYAPFIEKVEKSNVNEKRPLFSVIIPTYNRCDLLLKTLDAAIKQKNISSDEFEFVVADNGSKDETEKVVENFAIQNGKTSIVYVKLKRNYGADFARNAAILNSRGNLLAFTDDDCIVPNNWLSEFRQELGADPEIAGVGGFKVPRSTREYLDAYHRFLMWKHFFSPHVRTKEFDLSRNHCGLTANVCYRRQIFAPLRGISRREKKLGGFNLYFKHIGFQEFKTRINKSGIKLLYEPKMVEHFAYFNLKTHILKLFPQSFDRYLLHKLHPDIWPGPSFLYFLKRTASDIRSILTGKANPPLFNRSLLDIVGFSFLSIITNFFLWFGKYWLVGK